MTFAERFVPLATEDQLIYDEHLVRYELASRLVAGKKVLDCASGDGYGSKLLSESAAEVVGVDIDKEAVDAAQAKYGDQRLRFVCDSAEALSSLPEAEFEAVVSLETIEHLADQGAYLDALKRVLRPDGFALISTPNRAVWGQQNPYHVHELEREELESLLKSRFASVKLYGQYNGLASLIKGEGESEGAILSHGLGQELYFLAIVSPDPACQLRIDSDIISFNPQAHARRENNPAWRLINRLYALGRKMSLS